MIHWPPRFEPKTAPIHVRNELTMSAPAETVWAWLVRASAWPSWYANAHAVRIESGGRDLTAGVEFRWRTFGIPLVSRVHEFVPVARIGWFARGPGVDVYHAWLIEPREDGGCWVLTEETQYGLMSRLGHFFLPRRMGQWHQVWLERMAEKAAGGMPR